MNQEQQRHIDAFGQRVNALRIPEEDYPNSMSIGVGLHTSRVVFQGGEQVRPAFNSLMLGFELLKYVMEMAPHEVNDTPLIRALVRKTPEFVLLVDQVQERLAVRNTVFTLAAWFYLQPNAANPQHKDMCSKRRVYKDVVTSTNFPDTCQRWGIIMRLCLEDQPAQQDDQESEEQQEEQEVEQEEEKQEEDTFTAPTAGQTDRCFEVDVLKLFFKIPG